MSTELGKFAEIQFTEFNGGVRGKCLQLTSIERPELIQLTKSQAALIAGILYGWAIAD